MLKAPGAGQTPEVQAQMAGDVNERLSNAVDSLKARYAAGKVRVPFPGPQRRCTSTNTDCAHLTHQKNTLVYIRAHTHEHIE